MQTTDLQDAIMAIDLQTRLDEAEAAYHNWMTGQSVVQFRDHNGEMVQYTTANAIRLAAYITQLKLQLGQISTSAISPARPWFG